MPEADPASPPKPAFSGNRALIVEDNPEFLFHLSTAIKQLEGDWSIDAVRTARDAISLIEDPGCRYRVALVDIGLPDQSGIEVVRAIAARDAEIPVLVVSILSTEETVLSAIRAGARGYLLKDDSASIIRDAIDQVLNDQYPISPALARYLFRLAKAEPETGQGPALTNRELDVLTKLSEGMTYPEIAESLDLSISTVRTHIQKIYRKLNAKTGSEAVAVAKTNRLI